MSTIRGVWLKVSALKENCLIDFSFILSAFPKFLIIIFDNTLQKNNLCVFLSEKKGNALLVLGDFNVTLNKRIASFFINILIQKISTRKPVKYLWKEMETFRFIEWLNCISPFILINRYSKKNPLNYQKTHKEKLQAMDFEIFFHVVKNHI